VECGTMTGKHKVEIRNNKTVYKLEFERNISIITGDSGTGKTTLVGLVRSYAMYGGKSGIVLSCDKPCVILEGNDWKNRLKNIRDSIVFIDEGSEFIVTKEFARNIKNTDNYYVLVTRENLFDLPYSVEAVYGLRGRKYFNLKRTYNHLYRLYGEHTAMEKTDCLIAEDSNSGYQFFAAYAEQHGVECVSAKGNSNLYAVLKNIDKKHPVVVADGAAFGPYMPILMELQRTERERTIGLYLPESFEWLILQSGLLDDKEIRKILADPARWIESGKYFSWERFFTELLIEKSKDTYLAYKKRTLNEAYLQPHEMQEILKNVPSLGLESNQ
jgi:hypothetical protein